MWCTWSCNGSHGNAAHPRSMRSPRSENNLVPIDVDEVAVLAADPNFPENGRLRIKLEGGR